MLTRSFAYRWHFLFSNFLKADEGYEEYKK